MIDIGGMPVIWHIMKNFYEQGYDDFIIAAGYKQEYIKQWFYNRAIYSNDITISQDTHGYTNIRYHLKEDTIENWKVTIVNTGLDTQTGGRILRLKDYLGDEPFIVTYGDGVADINVDAVIDTFNRGNTIGTISTYNYQQNKGVVNVVDGKVESFREKSELDSQLINIGFMVFSKDMLNYLSDDTTNLEKDCLTKLASEGQLSTYVHKGFWQCMDTLREKNKLEELWMSGNAPWKNWEN
jgi:glucose-1-phosphate cytidylyltransferase